MAFWNRKRSVPYEEYWVASVGQALQSENISFFEGDLFFALFPDQKYKPSADRRKILADSGLSVGDFRSYLLISVTGLVCATAYMDSQKEFSRFRYASSLPPNAPALISMFKNNNMDADLATQELMRAFLGQVCEHLPAWALNGSETYGPLQSLDGWQRNAFLQSNILFSFLVSFFAERSNSIRDALMNQPAESRDNICSSIGSMTRLQSTIKKELNLN